MSKYIKANNILTIKVHNNDFKLINIWLKVARLRICFLNQSLFKVFDLSNDELHQRSCQGDRVTAASSGIQIESMIYYYVFFGKIPPT